MTNQTTRRRFIRQAAAAGLWLEVGSLLAEERQQQPPSRRLNVAVVGVGGRGAANLAGVGHENVVALVDVDADHLGKAKQGFPQAHGYADYRAMLEQPGIDAVVVSTPDHTHAVVAAAAMKLGKHVYCEKPLAHSVAETRTLRRLAVERKLVTQMGTQIHAGTNYRRVVELVKSDILGPVERVHVWFAGMPRVFHHTKPQRVPESLDYDLWLGPAAHRPYVPEHVHYNWRYWWAFGNGVLGDFGCHYMDLAYWALDLTAPTKIVAVGEKGHDGDNDVPMRQQVDYYFPAVGSRPAVHMTWRHGGWKPDGAEKYRFADAVLFVGKHGELIADYTRHRLLPAEKFRDARVPKSIPDSIGHHREWLEAIKTGGPTTCPFDYSGALTETALLGNVAYRAGNATLEWDSKRLKVTNCVPGVAELLDTPIRQGWSL